MSNDFSIPAKDAQAYSLMRTYDLSDDDLKLFLATMLGELKVLAEYAKLTGVANNLQAALSKLETEEVQTSI